MSAPVVGQRVWVIYRFWDAAGRLLYVGQTERDAYVRWMEHLADKWWAPLIAAAAVDSTTYDSLPAVLKAEKLLIKNHPRPYCNVEHNLDNPDRWLPPAHVATVRRSGPRTGYRTQSFAPRRSAGLARWQWIGIGVVALWLVLAGSLWAMIGDALPAKHGAELAAVTTTVILVAASCARPKRRRYRRYRR